jgi:hypothetical protein
MKSQISLILDLRDSAMSSLRILMRSALIVAVLAAAVGVVSLLAPSSARAEGQENQKTDAEKHLDLIKDAGNKLEAARKAREAAENTPSVGLDAQIANAWNRLSLAYRARGAAQNVLDSLPMVGATPINRGRELEIQQKLADLEKAIHEANYKLDDADNEADRKAANTAIGDLQKKPRRNCKRN